MALLNHKMLRRSPLTPPCVWQTSGCDTDSHPQRLLWGSGYQLPLSPALIPHAHWRRTKGGREENGIGNSEKIEWHKETSDEKYCGILDRLKKDELFHFKDDSLFFFFVLGLWCKRKKASLDDGKQNLFVRFPLSWNILRLQITLQQN